ncbi:MAG TPA: nickel-dependent hydrogenase large subunit, partial [Candidatus Limnocylindria bacterium]
MHTGTPQDGDLHFEVGQLTRVEGEGSLDLRVAADGTVAAQLRIFEAPRYFERLVVGRTPDEVIDIVARICGICPVAYQMSAVHAFEHLLEVEIDPAVRLLRRLLYCGEWIESHALHIFLLHAPDFLGYPSALEMAHDHLELVSRGLSMKKLGNRIVAIVGARAIHPLSVRVGGFSRAPRAQEFDELRSPLETAITEAEATVKWAASLDTPPSDREPRLVSLRHPGEYPMSDGRIVSSDGIDLSPDDWGSAFHEVQVPWSHALQASAADGVPYLLGPTARVALAADQLHPRAAAALKATRISPEALRRNVFHSIVA